MFAFVAFILALISTLLLGLGTILVKWVAMQVGTLIFVCILGTLFLAFVILLEEK